MELQLFLVLCFVGSAMLVQIDDEETLRNTLLHPNRDELAPEETVSVLKKLGGIYEQYLRADENDIAAKVMKAFVSDWLKPNEIKKENCNVEYIRALDETIEYHADHSHHNLVRYLNDCKARQLKLWKESRLPSINMNVFLNLLYSEELETEPPMTFNTIKLLESAYFERLVRDNEDIGAKIMHKVFDEWLKLNWISEENCNEAYFKHLDELISEQTKKKHPNLVKYFNECRRRQLEMCKSVGKPIELPDETTTNEKQQVLA